MQGCNPSAELEAGAGEVVETCPSAFIATMNEGTFYGTGKKPARQYSPCPARRS